MLACRRLSSRRARDREIVAAYELLLLIRRLRYSSPILIHRHALPLGRRSIGARSLRSPIGGGTRFLLPRGFTTSLGRAVFTPLAYFPAPGKPAHLNPRI